MSKYILDLTHYTSKYSASKSNNKAYRKKTMWLAHWEKLPLGHGDPAVFLE